MKSSSQSKSEAPSLGLACGPDLRERSAIASAALATTMPIVTAAPSTSGGTAACLESPAERPAERTRASKSASASLPKPQPSAGGGMFGGGESGGTLGGGNTSDGA
jgi:hypothetical protein